MLIDLNMKANLVSAWLIGITQTVACCVYLIQGFVTMLFTSIALVDGSRLVKCVLLVCIISLISPLLVKPHGCM